MAVLLGGPRIKVSTGSARPVACSVESAHGTEFSCVILGVARQIRFNWEAGVYSGRALTRDGVAEV